MKNYYFLTLVKVFFDIIIILVSFAIAYMMRFNLFQIAYLPIIPYKRFLVFIVILWPIIFNMMGLYKPQRDKSERVDSMLLISMAITLSAVVTYLVIIIFFQEAMFSYSLIIYAWIISLVLINIIRYLIWKMRAIKTCQKSE